MKIFAYFRRAVTGNPIAAGSFALIALVLIAIAIAVPLVRSAEAERFEEAASHSSQLLIDALANPAIFSGEPDTALLELRGKVDALSRAHDQVVLGKAYFAKNAARAALDYTEYTAHLGAKLLQVEETQVHARAAYDAYVQGVDTLKASNLAARAQAQVDVNSLTSEARAATELAYQECVLLDSLTRELGTAKIHALKDLRDVGPDVQPAVAALQPRLREALEASHLRRKVFNPGVRSPF